jgi:hypothetical protein
MQNHAAQQLNQPRNKSKHSHPGNLANLPGSLLIADKPQGLQRTNGANRLFAARHKPKMPSFRHSSAIVAPHTSIVMHYSMHWQKIQNKQVSYGY